MFLQITGLGEAVEAHVALVGLAAIVEPEMVKYVAALLECAVAPFHPADIKGLGFFIS